MSDRPDRILDQRLRADELRDEWMCEEWLPKIASGQVNDAIAFTEPNHGSDVAGIESTARLEGEEWALNGEKKWTGNASVADVLVVFAKTDPAAGRRGISAFLVPADVDGLSTEAIEISTAVTPCP